MEKAVSNNALEWIEKQIQRDQRREKILTPITWVIIILWIAVLWSLPVLDMMGKLH